MGRVAVDSGRWLVAQLQRGREGGLVWVRLLGLGPAQPHSGLGNIENREIKKAFVGAWSCGYGPDFQHPALTPSVLCFMELTLTRF